MRVFAKHGLMYFCNARRRAEWIVVESRGSPESMSGALIGLSSKNSSMGEFSCGDQACDLGVD
jgi:hypothetical protein